MRRRTGGRGSRATTVVVVAALSGLLLSGCGTDGYEPRGPFRPLPEGAPPQVGPPSSKAPAPGGPARPESGEEAGDPAVVASGLAVPTGVALLPDGSAVVGERDTGRLLQVFPDRTPARELMTLPGIDPGGDGGLLGLAVSPTYLEDGLLYAYVSTTADNRVLRFPVGGTPNPVVTGIPRGESHNGGGLVFGADGHLFVGTGDTGDPALAADPNSLAGKVLRVDVFGRAVGAGPVYSRGHRDVTALCRSGAPDEAGQDTLFATDESTGGADELNVVVEGGNYAVIPPVVEIPGEEGGLGGCAAAGTTVFLGALDGERVHGITLDAAGAVTGDPEDLLDGEYGRLRSLALDAEGALWITTSNRDGVGTPVEDDDKVLRILPPSTSSSPL